MVEMVIEHSLYTVIRRVGYSLGNAVCSWNLGKAVIVYAQAIVLE